MIGTKDNDYAYIEVFIGYLREIIEIIKDLFSALTKKTEDPTEAESTTATTPVV